jgi:hypothetical protein
MRSLHLYFKDSSMLVVEQGSASVEKTFSTDDEALEIARSVIKPLNPDEVLCFFAGSRLISKIQTTSVEHEEPFSLRTSLLTEETGKIAGAFLKEHADKQEMLELIDKQVVSIKADGYPIMKLDGQNAKKLDIVIHLSAISQPFMEKMRASLNFLPKNALKPASFVTGMRKTLIGAFSNDSFIACCVHERTSDMIVGKGSDFFASVTLPMGKDHVIEHLTKGMSIDTQKAESYLALYSQGQLDQSLLVALQQSLESFHLSWNQEVIKALNVLSEGTYLPSDVYLLIPNRFAKAFEGFFSDESYHAQNFTGDGFIVHMLEEKTLFL